MKILMVEPGKAPKEKNISGTLDSMQEAVGGTLMFHVKQIAGKPLNKGIERIKQ